MKWTFERDVEEWIEVEADDEESARILANESPIEEWMREVHDERTYRSL